MRSASPAARPSSLADAPSDHARPRARRRLLVVDDEPIVCAVLARILGADHDVVTCASAREALDRISRDEPFDLVFADLFMPGLSGMELHAELQLRWPRLASRMIFITGGACTERTRAFLSRPGMECLEKPFELGVLLEAVERRLAAA